MAKYKVSISIESNTPAKVQELGNLIQGAVNKINQDDIIALLKGVSKNPSVVKSALNWM